MLDPKRLLNVDRQSRLGAAAVTTLSSIEEKCAVTEITLVLHPAVKTALRGYEDAFYIGVRCFLAGEGDGVFFLPLPSGGYTRLLFSKRSSAGGYDIVRVDPVRPEDMVQIKGESLLSRRC
jgi:hypothetical protein